MPDAEDELGNNAVDEIQSKLEKVEGKLEETETYCYQVVEENVELKAEMEKSGDRDIRSPRHFQRQGCKEFKKLVGARKSS